MAEQRSAQVVVHPRSKRVVLALALLVGLAVSPLGGATVSAAAAPGEPAPICQAPTQAPASGAWVGDQRAQQDVVAVDQAVAASGTDVLGTVADDQSQSLIVVVDSAASATEVKDLQTEVAAASGTVDVSVRSSCRPLDQLEAVQTDLRGLHDGKLAGATYAYEIDPATGTVAVTAADEATAQTVASTFGDEVTVTVADLARTSGGRTNDASPHYGDARIVGPSRSCSSNFSFRNNVFGTRVTATAGHCGTGAWYSGSNLVGSVVYQSLPNPDVEMLYASGQNHTNVIYTDPCCPSTRTVTGKHDPALNELVCVGGSSTLADCGAIVLSVSATYCDYYGCTTNLDHAFLLGNTQLCNSADSGGVVYQRDGSTDAVANGLIIASVGPGFGGWGCYFHRISTVEAAINSTLLTSP